MHFLPIRSIACNNKSIFSRFHDKVIIGFRLWCRIDVQRMCFPQPRIAHIPGHPGNDIARSCFRTPEVINASAIPIRMQMGRQNQIYMACIKTTFHFLSVLAKSSAAHFFSLSNKSGYHSFNSLSCVSSTVKCTSPQSKE